MRCLDRLAAPDYRQTYRKVEQAYVTGTIALESCGFLGVKEWHGAFEERGQVEGKRNGPVTVTPLRFQRYSIDTS